MDFNLSAGLYKIVSLVDGNPLVGITDLKPDEQFAYLTGPVNDWTIDKEGENTYQFSVVGYPYTGVAADRILVTTHDEQNVKWIATYQEGQKAYTIEPANDKGNGWTVADGSSTAEIAIKPFIVSPSEPPKFSTSQLFRLEFVPPPE